ncbi:quercetin 2,3-dioxygenase [Lampropedia cohaerens]|uniref:Quercetin 2,3-dioxygenase n=1 Tax=Lampropedia cohaerens TaxID=1610491 RepID=A0A0U1PWP8_9BURK|nr:pirin family protein [Lampropedia cohaerens]KKW66973.1 quercetin 2,3-dioxygenase [Lampropedia cohaerens]
MITIRPSMKRGFADHGWLKSFHSFSFAEYHDPAHMGWGNLRVINEDCVAPGVGFGMHGHRDMEIISYVLSGALAHKDSMGNTKTVSAGEVQCMSAGTGVMHSEFNPDAREPVHFLQIWILPDRLGIAPGYAQKRFEDVEKRGRLRRIAAPDDADGALVIHADAHVYAGLFDGGEQARLPLQPGRKGYVFVVRGSVAVNGQPLSAGDAALLAEEPQVLLTDGMDAEVLVFDLQA